VKKWDNSFEDQLFLAKNYRSFLGCFFSDLVKRQSPKVLTYQLFADRSGFSSKSFIRDVIVGKKRLTLRSLPKVIEGLKLNRQWAQYFAILVRIEEDGCRSLKYNKNIELQKLASIQLRIESKRTKKMVKDKAELNVFLSKNFPEVYAALGTPEKGACFEDIQKRTNLDLKELESCLKKIVQYNFATFDEEKNCYIPKEHTLFNNSLLDSNIFKLDYFRSLDKVSKRFHTQSKSSDSLFMSVTVPTDSKKLNLFQKKLFDLVDEFSDELEVAEGDNISEINIAFTHTNF